MLLQKIYIEYHNYYCFVLCLIRPFLKHWFTFINPSHFILFKISPETTHPLGPLSILNSHNFIFLSNTHIFSQSGLDYQNLLCHQSEEMKDVMWLTSWCGQPIHCQVEEDAQVGGNGLMVGQCNHDHSLLTPGHCVLKMRVKTQSWSSCWD